VPVGAVFGFCNMLFRLVQDMPGEQMLVVFDKGKASFRDAIYDGYKANRLEPPDDLKPQFPLVREAAHALGLPVIELEGCEADDIIATYAREAEAAVLAVNERGGLILDRTVFYAASGGQPGDTGEILRANGRIVPVAATVYGDGKAEIVHVPADGAEAIRPGETVTARIDWARRHCLMRMHTALHLLCSLVPYPVTGGAIDAEESRLDFDIEDAGAVDRDALTAALNALVAADHPVTTRWISDEDLADNPALVRTMSVKPPTGTGRVRLVAVGADGAVDLQPCGGTHVRSTAEIGPLAVAKIEKKGRQNRRIRLRFAQGA
jgi:misacylated tRNA(Ala) deacylase